MTNPTIIEVQPLTQEDLDFAEILERFKAFGYPPVEAATMAGEIVYNDVLRMY